MGNPFGIWMVFLANWSGNRTYSRVGALLGRPYRKGLIVGDKPFLLYNLFDSVRIDVRPWPRKNLAAWENIAAKIIRS